MQPKHAQPSSVASATPAQTSPVSLTAITVPGARLPLAGTAPPVADSGADALLHTEPDATAPGDDVTLLEPRLGVAYPVTVTHDGVDFSFRVEFWADVICYCQDKGMKVDLERGTLRHPGSGRQIELTHGRADFEQRHQRDAPAWLCQLPDGQLVMPKGTTTVRIRERRGDAIRLAVGLEGGWKALSPAPPAKAPAEPRPMDPEHTGSQAFLGRDGIHRLLTEVTRGEVDLTVQLQVTRGAWVRAGTLPSLPQLTVFCHALAANPQLPFKCAYGMPALSHVTCQKLREVGYNAVKLFVTGPRLQVCNALLPPTRMRFCSAALVFVTDRRNSVVPYVIDPGQSGAPLPVASWLRTISVGPTTLTVAPPGQYLPHDVGAGQRDAATQLGEVQRDLTTYRRVAQEMAAAVAGRAGTAVMMFSSRVAAAERDTGRQRCYVAFTTQAAYFWVELGQTALLRRLHNAYLHRSVLYVEVNAVSGRILRVEPLLTDR